MVYTNLSCHFDPAMREEISALRFLSLLRFSETTLEMTLLLNVTVCYYMTCVVLKILTLISTTGYPNKM